jgi:hypothetical protein
LGRNGILRSGSKVGKGSGLLVSVLRRRYQGRQGQGRCSQRCAPAAVRSAVLRGGLRAARRPRHASTPFVRAAASPAVTTAEKLGARGCGALATFYRASPTTTVLLTIRRAAAPPRLCAVALHAAHQADLPCPSLCPAAAGSGGSRALLVDGFRVYLDDGGIRSLRG